MSTGNLVRIVAGLVTLAMSASITPAISAGNKPPAQVLFTNVNIFDGFSDQPQKGMSVLVEDNHIKEAGRGLKAGAEATVIDGGGRTMTPGLIDMHGHVTFNTPEGTNTFTYEWDFGASGALAAQALRDDMLMKGITTARDIVGNSRGIANVIKNLKIENLPAIGEELITQIDIEHEIMNFTIIKGISKVGDKVMAQCQMNIFIADKEQQV